MGYPSVTENQYMHSKNLTKSKGTALSCRSSSQSHSEVFKPEQKALTSLQA